MKKLYSLLALTFCLLAGVSANAQTVTFDFAANPWEHAIGSGNGETAAAGNMEEPIVATADNDGVELSFGQGTASQPPRYWTGPQLRVYNGNTLTFRPTTEGKAIVSVEFTATGASYFGVTATTGTLDGTTWTGNQNEVTFTGTKTNRLTAITVTLADADENTETPGANVTMPSISPRNNTNRTDSVVVTITGDEDTQIFYTLDGTDPTSQSMLYTEPFKLTESATVKAIAYDAEGNASAIAEVSYTITPSEQPGDEPGTEPGDTTVVVVSGYVFERANAIESGKQYLIVATVDGTQKVAQAITSKYGYLKVADATLGEDGAIVLESLDNAFTITQTEDASAVTYTIKQADDRFVYQTGTYNSFNVDAAPADGQNWTAQLNNDGQTWTITNTSVQKYVQYSISHTSFGSYAAAQDNAVLPELWVLTKYVEAEPGDEPGDEPVENEGVTFPFSENPWQLETGSGSNQQGGAIAEPLTVDGVTLTTDNGGGSTVVRMWDTNGNVTLRVYKGTSIQFAAEDETKAINKVVFDATLSDFTTEVGTFDASTKTWTGNATAVNFVRPSTASGTMQIKSATVYLGERNDETVVPGIYVAAPVISPAGGERSDSVTVTIKAGEGSYIFYTTDGTEPTWDSTPYTEAFKLYESATVKAIAYDDEGNPSAVTEATFTITVTEKDPDAIFEEAATSSDNQLEVEDVMLADGLEKVWSFSSSYGAVATAYVSSTKTNYDSESWLKLPVLSLPADRPARLTFEHAINKFFTDSLTQATLWIRVVEGSTRSLKAVEGDWQQLPLYFPEIAPGKTFSSFGAEEISLADFVGKDVQIGFRYLSTSESAGTWEIRNIKVDTDELTALTEALTLQPAAQPAAVYDLQGRRVASPAKGGIYIIAGKKVMVK